MVKLYSFIHYKPDTGYMKKSSTNTRNILRSLLFLLFITQLVSCTEAKRKDNSIQILPGIQDTIKSKPPGSFSDTIIIDFPAAVFYNPDSMQLEKIKAITDTMIFESNIHDCFYQMKYSRNAIQKNWPTIKIIEISKYRYVHFKSSEGLDEYIDLNKQEDFCGIFLFDGHKKASFADMSNIDSELGFYFNK